MDTSRACGIALGFLVDAALADPSRWHPVAGFGAVASRVEGLLHPPADAVDAHAAAGAHDTTAGRVAVRARGVVFTV
ncbi:cobalamin biosynthesis protein, partial [Dietzia sp. E1]|nr:cobalamin biosynthesis protein [Dietzia sp. E1]